MLRRPLPARRSLAQPRLNALGSLHPALMACTPRPLGTQPDLVSLRRRTTQRPRAILSQRPLATAVDETMLREQMPFDQLHWPMPTSFTQPQSRPKLWELRSFDPSSTIRVTPEESLPRSRQHNSGMPGGVEEMMSVFDACLQVNQLERAALVLERLGFLGVLPDAEMMELHHQYLDAAIDRAMEEPRTTWTASLHTWYELQIRSKNLPQTLETIAFMVKVSLLSAHTTSELELQMQRYMDMVPDYSLTRFIREGILDHEEFRQIFSIGNSDGHWARADWNSPLREEMLAIVNGEPQAAPESEAIGVETPNFETFDTETFDPEMLDSEAREPDEVRPTPQKGLGLKTLRSTLSIFDKMKDQDLSGLPKDQLRELQKHLEQDCVNAAIERWRLEHASLAKMGRSTALSSRALNPQVYEWHQSLEAKLKDEFRLIQRSGVKRQSKTEASLDRALYGPFVLMSTPSRLAAITIITTMNAMAVNGADKGLPLSALLVNLSKAIEDDINFARRQKEQHQRKKAMHKIRSEEWAQEARELSKDPSTLAGAAAADATSPSIVSDPIAPTAPSAPTAPTVPTYNNNSWPLLIRLKMGALLMSMLVDSAKVLVTREHRETKELVSQMQPAFSHTMLFRRGRKVGVLLPNKHFTKLLRHEPRSDFLAKHLPMLVEPASWSKFERGAFVSTPAALIRIRSGERDQRIYTDTAFVRGDMEQVAKGLDVLGRTAWRINRPVFEVMREAWNSGVKIANIPAMNPDIPVPPQPERDSDPSVRRLWMQALKEAENERSGLHSERCFMNFQMEIANAFRDQTFYFPHNMDFRGRAYPIPSYLNHMGADNVRGILRFAQGRELGERGLQWLKVHLANLAGYDKASLSDRETFTNDHLDDIFDSANNALSGRRWWLRAEDPWQCLAACMELKAALDSPEPTKYVSHLPVHQDGTCNGLQHYAALGGDTWGAQQVNLTPGDRPADVYAAVADLVSAAIAEDSDTHNERVRKALEGKITRKIVKQTVMTNVYGVTYIGAKIQVLKQLENAYPDIATEAGVSTPLLAAYIARKIFQALGTMFRGAHEIQFWLAECASRVCRALTPEQMDRIAEAVATKEKPPTKTRGGKPVKATDIDSQFRSTLVWTTPLRMPVVQPYRKGAMRAIRTSLQNLILQDPNSSDPVDARKQRQAFPPNFIHSLDASHMLLSALECSESGLTFAAVHDSFWTHAGDVDAMNRILRDSFIRIHSEDVIERLHAEFKARYRGSIYLAKVKMTSKLGAQVTALRRKFSNRRNNMILEMVQEKERLRLLGSSDPEEVEKGRAMETPASLYEASLQHGTATVVNEVDPADLDSMALFGEKDSAQPELDDDEADLDSAYASDEKAPTEPDMDGEEYDVRLNRPQLERGPNAASRLEASDVSPFEESFNSYKKDQETRAGPRYLNLWLPLSFPKVPKKGDFNVSQLKDSLYFFS
ncbi:DNA-dependent RNA polymerase [Xylariaceae sp. FL0804]|nr:DNA-dependent RNA polymerase [Xylariaceae sp. FL0804]